MYNKFNIYLVAVVSCRLCLASTAYTLFIYFFLLLVSHQRGGNRLHINCLQ